MTIGKSHIAGITMSFNEISPIPVAIRTCIHDESRTGHHTCPNKLLKG